MYVVNKDTCIKKQLLKYKQLPCSSMTYLEAKNTMDAYYDRLIGKPIALARIVHLIISDEDNLSSVYKLVVLNKIKNNDALTSIGIINNKNLNVFLFGSLHSMQGFSTLEKYLSNNRI